MNECLSCKHWQRNSYDGVVGLCALLGELRFQYEQENMFCTYEFGEDRKPSRDRNRYVPIEEKREQPALQFSEKPIPYWKVNQAERRYGKDTA